MEIKEEIFNKLGHSAEKYVKHINFLCQRIHGCTHHLYLKSRDMESWKKDLDLGDRFNLPPIDYYEGDFNDDWEELKEKRKLELHTSVSSSLPLTIEQKTELIKEFISELIKIKNDYFKEADASTIRAYAAFMEQLNSETDL